MRFLQILTIAALGTLPVAYADGKDDEKKAEKEFREAEGEQEKEKQGEGQAPPAGGPLEDNPLEKILELMNEVENKLFEADTGEFTQEEQKQIVEAMRFEEKTHEALEELIRKIEEQAEQQQSSSSSSSEEQKKQQQQQQQDQKNQQNQNESEQERQQRLQREKEEERQRQAKEKQQQQQQQAQQNPQNGKEDKQPQEGQEAKPPEDDSNPTEDKERAGGRWGSLPKKLHQDAGRASEREVPEAYRKYYERLTEKFSGKPSKKR